MNKIIIFKMKRQLTMIQKKNIYIKVNLEEGGASGCESGRRKKKSEGNI